ncbi:hypothetical protein SFR_3381 [Streptomyces sp. FR-008]|nr:hypothetical protein SFR_3381 [Streptomyces sp. FR-008]
MVVVLAVAAGGRVRLGPRAGAVLAHLDHLAMPVKGHAELGERVDLGPAVRDVGGGRVRRQAGGAPRAGGAGVGDGHVTPRGDGAGRSGAPPPPGEGGTWLGGSTAGSRAGGP